MTQPEVTRGRLYPDGPYVFTGCEAPQIDMSAMPPLPPAPMDLYWPEPESGGGG